MNKVVITGAANGIGKATVMACLAQGFYVIAADKDMAGLERLAAQTGRENLETHYADFSDFSTIETFIPDLYDRHETLYALVNNAGLYYGKSVYRYSNVEIDEVWAVNLKALIYLSKDFARREMEHHAFRSIVNVTSVAGEVGSCDALYGATKAGVIGLTKANAWNFAPYIRVNAVSPGLVHDTAIYDRIPDHRRDEYQRQETLDDPITPSGVADVIVFLLSEKSRHLTGKIIAVDNGAYPR
ncbi:SDR family NAD(P)-dependent oxidoreductase [Pseudomonas sp. NA-150]|uniref:SDR family NAD(P)-dependent oxidoreductase n=1 Tax=Pseudomonas sp. NA-150 TaxID=3367525 RepID=UPI0037CB4110